MVKLSHKLIAFQVWRLSTGSIPVVEVTSRVMSPLTSCHVRIFRKFGSLPKCQQTKSRPMGARGARSPNSVGRRGDGGGQSKTSPDKRKQGRTRKERQGLGRYGKGSEGKLGQRTERQDNTKLGRAGEGKARHDKARQGTRGQAKSRQDKTRQEKKRQVNSVVQDGRHAELISTNKTNVHTILDQSR